MSFIVSILTKLGLVGLLVVGFFKVTEIQKSQQEYFAQVWKYTPDIDNLPQTRLHQLEAAGD